MIVRTLNSHIVYDPLSQFGIICMFAVEHMEGKYKGNCAFPTGEEGAAVDRNSRDAVGGHS